MKVKVFLSYAHEDEEMKKELDKALIMLKRSGKIETWNDRCIRAGSMLNTEIDKNLNEANIILLLVSTDFLVSDYCYTKEMSTALEKNKERKAVVIPIILRQCDWLNSELKNLTALPTDGKPIKSYRDSDEAYYIVKEGIEKIVDEIIENNNKINPQ